MRNLYETFLCHFVIVSVCFMDLETGILRKQINEELQALNILCFTIYLMDRIG